MRDIREIPLCQVCTSGFAHYSLKVHAGTGARQMELLPELKTAYRFSMKGVVAKITLIMAIVSSVRLVTDVFRLPLPGFLSKLMYFYEVIFHTVIDAALKWLPFVIPPKVKDIAILYFLVGFIFQKVVFAKVVINYHNPRIILHDYKNSKILYFCGATLNLLMAVVFWPVYMTKMLHKPFLVVTHGSGGRPSALHFSATGRVDSEAYAYLGDSRLMMLLRLAIIIVGVLVVISISFVWKMLL